MDRTLPLRRLRPALIFFALAATAACSEDVPPQGADLLVYDWLVGSYYAELSIEEAAAEGAVPDLMRLDPAVDFPAVRASFGQDLGVDRYAVRWEGYIYAQDARGIVVAGLGRAGLLIDGAVIFAPQAEGGLIDERRPVDLRDGWHHMELWYENLDANTHSIRMGWMSPNSDLIPIANGYRGLGSQHLPDVPINLRCEAAPLRFQSGHVTVLADTPVNLQVSAGPNNLTSDVAISRLDRNLLQLDPGTEITVNVTATTLEGETETTSCTFLTEQLPHWIEGHWRAEYYELSNEEAFAEPVGTRFEPNPPVYPSDMPYQSERTEWFPTAGCNTFSVRWSAWLRVDNAATHRFELRGDDGARMFVNDEEVLDLWREGWEEEDGIRTDLPLEPGYHLVEVEYYQTYGQSYVDWEVQEIGGDGSATVVDPTRLTAEILEEPEDSPAILEARQHPLDQEDNSYPLFEAAGCIEAIDLYLNQPASVVEVEGELLELSRPGAGTVQRLCVLQGTELLGRVRLADVDGQETDWMRVDFTRPTPEEPGDGM